MSLGILQIDLNLSLDKRHTLSYFVSMISFFLYCYFLCASSIDYFCVIGFKFWTVIQILLVGRNGLQGGKDFQMFTKKFQIYLIFVQM